MNGRFNVIISTLCEEEEEEEWLRFHYILYMSEMPGRLPAECVCPPPSLPHTEIQRLYLSRFQLCKMDLSRGVARGRSHEPLRRREAERRAEKREAV